MSVIDVTPAILGPEASTKQQADWPSVFGDVQRGLCEKNWVLDYWIRAARLRFCDRPNFPNEGRTLPGKGRSCRMDHLRQSVARFLLLLSV
jgi:hypothetical protein